MRALPGVCLLDRYLELSGAFFRIGKRTVRIFLGVIIFGVWWSFWAGVQVMGKEGM